VLTALEELVVREAAMQVRKCRVDAQIETASARAMIPSG
jgi:hypothetical protein